MSWNGVIFLRTACMMSACQGGKKLFFLPDHYIFIIICNNKNINHSAWETVILVCFACSVMLCLISATSTWMSYHSLIYEKMILFRKLLLRSQSTFKFRTQEVLLLLRNMFNVSNPCEKAASWKSWWGVSLVGSDCIWGTGDWCECPWIIIKKIISIKAMPID